MQCTRTLDKEFCPWWNGLPFSSHAQTGHQTKSIHNPELVRVTAFFSVIKLSPVLPFSPLEIHSSYYFRQSDLDTDISRPGRSPADMQIQQIRFGHNHQVLATSFGTKTNLLLHTLPSCQLCWTHLVLRRKQRVQGNSCYCRMYSSWQ